MCSDPPKRKCSQTNHRPFTLLTITLLHFQINSQTDRPTLYSAQLKECRGLKLACYDVLRIIMTTNLSDFHDFSCKQLRLFPVTEVRIL